MKYGTRMKDFADEVPCKLLIRKEGYFLFIDEADCKGSGGLYRIIKMERGQLIDEVLYEIKRGEFE
jgi:hypothetical protein